MLEAPKASIEDGDDMRALSRIAARLYRVSADHGFHEGEVIGPQAATTERIAIFVANLHGECSELWEAYRKGSLFDTCDKNTRALALPPLTNAEEELADIIIRALDTAHTLGIDVGRAITIKTAYNEQRPHKHGKKC
jgi:NTP pyrophosphatase (non-canonical NTP hydrolase)